LTAADAVTAVAAKPAAATVLTGNLKKLKRQTSHTLENYHKKN
jgi:hypothetical protein